MVARRPARALPMLNPTLRTIWLIDRTLGVSCCGTPSSTSLGMIAETPPTPKPRTAIAAHGSSSFPTSRAAPALSNIPKARNDLTVTGSSRVLSATTCQLRHSIFWPANKSALHAASRSSTPRSKLEPSSTNRHKPT
jgi:hypothetical protein